MSVLRLSNVGKRFDKVEDRSAIGPVAGGLRRSRHSDLWAVRGVDLEVQKGESIAILGRNGAGKTTLLSLLAGLTAPSEGRIQVTGRIAPLIAVGVGFHPELTGRENVHLNAAVLGMSPSETTRRFDEIVDFSGIEQFIDAPSKTYSSGMYVRLGFAVAVCATPDVLLVDEILSVGDVEFARKCFNRMAELRTEGTTIVLASHNMDALQVFCDRGVVLDHGALLRDGPISAAVSTYMTTLDPSLPEAAATAVQIELLHTDGTASSNVRSGDSVIVRLHARHPGEALRVTVENERLVVWEQLLPWHDDVDVVVPLPLVSGGYTVTASLVGVPGAQAEASLHVSSVNRMVHGTLDLNARLVP